MTNCALKLEELNVPEWDYFVSEIKTIYRLTDEEAADFAESKTAKIIASIPFVAGCFRPEVTAISHLSLYMNEKKGFQRFCSCTSLDNIDLFERLEPISHFRGGDKKIIQYGMDTLAFIMIEGYHKSEKHDAENGNYNPFVSGDWNYKILKDKLYRNVFDDLNPFIFFPSIDGGGW